MTGAGRGIGRAHASLLAARGARVVVNDLGGSVDGEGIDASVAADVAREIVDSGGSAIADDHDIATVDGANALIAVAVDTFDRIDIVINNAGIMQWAEFPDADNQHLARHLAVHVGGAFNTTRAAWPHMLDQEYGRVVMTASTGMFGLPENLSYAAAKAGVVGLTRSLATAGARRGIKVNAIAPAAATRMGGDVADETVAPELVAPMAALLAHEECPANGEIYEAGAGRFARIFIASTVGYVNVAPTIEDLAQHWPSVNDEKEYYVPVDLTDWMRTYMGHLHAQ